KQSVEKAQASGETETKSLDEYKRWRDIWSAGQGVAQIHGVLSAKEVVDAMLKEYEQAVSALPRPVY
ncbi:MAG TPA: nitronate monooxygenase, partial [Leptospiraceae bacterium]|nr:nitronate monooxygenase [Leptospiraceae bacterium]